VGFFSLFYVIVFLCFLTQSSCAFLKKTIVYFCIFCRHFNTVDADIQRDTWTLLLKGSLENRFLLQCIIIVIIIGGS